jgi:hypothetical protein
MPTVVEFLYALRGLRRLVRFDIGGLGYFDLSIEGFWRSFRVALLIAPFYAIMIPYHLEALQPTVGWQHIMITEILTYIVGWLLYPLVAYEICRWIGRDTEYPGYIVVYNWSTILLIGAEMFVWLPTVAGMATTATSQRLDFLVTHIYLIYLWFIARGALRIPPLSAIGMVFTDYVLSSVLASIHDAMLKSPAS